MKIFAADETRLSAVLRLNEGVVPNSLPLPMRRLYVLGSASNRASGITPITGADRSQATERKHGLCAAPHHSVLLCWPGQ